MTPILSRMNKMVFFLPLNIFFYLYNDVLNQNIKISPLVHKKDNVSELPGQMFTKFGQNVKKLSSKV